MVETRSNQAITVRENRQLITDDSDQITRRIVEALEQDEGYVVKQMLALLPDAEVAGLIEHLSLDQRRRLVHLLGISLKPEILALLDEAIQSWVIEELGPKASVRALRKLPSDDAVAIISNLDVAMRSKLLAELPKGERRMFEDALSYPEDSAGRLMEREYIAIPESWNIGKIIDTLRSSHDAPKDFYDIFVIDRRRRPIGSLALSRILRAQRSEAAKDIMNRQIESIPASMDQEDIAFLFRNRGVTSHPVIDDRGRLVGVITIDDVIDVIDDEAAEDIMRMGGVREEDFHSAIVPAIRGRFPWLALNLIFTFAAAAVIAMFTDSIAQLLALAVLMPVIASMGGIAAVQTLTVTVRALAMKELVPTNRWRVLGREMLVNLGNGMVLAVVAAIGCYLWYRDLGLSVVVFVATIGNIGLAGLIGVMIPLGLNRFGFDPAVASGPCVTVVTDIFGFMTFLGLATMFLLN